MEAPINPRYWTDNQWINGHDSGTDLLEVPTIYKAYLLGLCKGIYPHNMVLYRTVAPFQDPEIPIGKMCLPEMARGYVFFPTCSKRNPSVPYMFKTYPLVKVYLLSNITIF